MKQFLRIVLILLLLGGLAAGGYWGYQQWRGTQATAAPTEFTQTVTVQRGDISANITVVGELVALQQEDLSFDALTGVTDLLTLAVNPGNHVDAGQELATIDKTPYEQALAEAKRTLQEATQALADLQAPVTELAQTQTELAVVQAELNLKQTLKDWDDLHTPTELTDLQTAVQDGQDNLTLAQLRQSLIDHNGLAKSERDLQYTVGWDQRRFWELDDLVRRHQANLEQMEEKDAVEQDLNELQADLTQVQLQISLSKQAAAADIADAQATLAQAQQDLADAQAGSDALTLATAQVTVQEATVNAQVAWQARDDLAAGPDPAEVATAQAAIDSAKQAVADAEATLVATTLRAPFAGTVLQTGAIPGGRITSDSIILTLANLAELQVAASVDETTIRQVAQGQPVQITFDAFPEQRFQGEVLAVPLQGTLQGDVMVYEVPISLPGTEDLPLLVGMTANAAIQIGQAEGVLLVPAMAIQSGRGRQMVLLPGLNEPGAPTPPAPRPVEVEVGLSDGIRTEVVSGLNEGDKVLVQMSAGSSNGNGIFRGGAGGGFFPGGGGGGATRRSGN